VFELQFLADRETPYVITTGSIVGLHLKELAYFRERHATVLGVLNEFQSLHRILSVKSVAGRGLSGGHQQTFILVEPDRVETHLSALRKLPDRQPGALWSRALEARGLRASGRRAVSLSGHRVEAGAEFPAGADAGYHEFSPIIITVSRVEPAVFLQDVVALEGSVGVLPTARSASKK
jgi:hypothetical protein